MSSISATDQLVILQYGQELTGDMERDAWCGPGDRDDMTRLCMDWNRDVERRLSACEAPDVTRMFYVRRVG